VERVVAQRQQKGLPPKIEPPQRRQIEIKPEGHREIRIFKRCETTGVSVLPFRP
jgi:hypothetical protein